MRKLTAYDSFTGHSLDVVKVRCTHMNKQQRVADDSGRIEEVFPVQTMVYAQALEEFGEHLTETDQKGVFEVSTKLTPRRAGDKVKRDSKGDIVR